MRSRPDAGRSSLSPATTTSLTPTSSTTARGCGSWTGSTPAWATRCSTSATFAVNHELDEHAERELLEAYSGDAGGDALTTLREMRFMSDFREAMWGVVQQGISELDFDFVAYADEHFARALGMEA